MIFFDPLYLVIALPGLLLGLWAQAKVKSAYGKYSRVATKSGLTGAEVAAKILRQAGVSNVTIEETPGKLSDHYDPRSRTLRLSAQVYSSNSVAAAGIAAHEAGHALQHKTAYVPLVLRSAIVPVANLGNKLVMPLFFLGYIMNLAGFFYAAIFVFTGVVIFQLVTLPVEFNASARAKTALASSGIITDSQESAGVSTVLNAAAMTYVAALITSLLQLLYFVLRARN
jgi:Zn-dependent membrane protease YugP